MVRNSRPSKAERATATKARRDGRKPAFNKQGQTWTWSDVLGLCTTAELTPHSEAEVYWKHQAQNKVYPKNRKIQMVDGSSPVLAHIQSGDTSGLQMTAKQKAVVSARISTTRTERGHNQTHWMEAAGIKVFCSMFETFYPGVLEFAALPDGLGADLVVKRCNVSDEWAAVQVKTAQAHPGERMQLSVKQVDGFQGGKYENMVILALGLDPGCKRPDGAATVFDTVADAVIQDIFVYQNASLLPGKVLNPYPRQQSKRDVFGLNRYTAGVNTVSDLQNIMDSFLQCVEAAPKFTKNDAWFCPVLNHKVSKKHRTEIDNMCMLATVFGGVQHLRAPLAQNETVDVVLQLKNDSSYRISLKTASLVKKGFHFMKSKAPNSHFCDAVIVFYIDRKTQERTHVSVIDAQKVYRGKSKCFCWSVTNNYNVFKNRINLKDVDAAQQIKQALSF
jgi:hypothetical protein